MKFNVVAHFAYPVEGLMRASSSLRSDDDVFAETPESAARMWLWRRSAAERAATDRVIVWAPKTRRMIPSYEGPTIVYSRCDGQLVEVERR